VSGPVEIEAGPDGLRARELGAVADVDHWEAQWSALDLDDRPAASGHLPRQLRTTVLARVRPPARVLEAGCGPAHFTLALHARGFRAVGLDWGAATLDRVRARHPDVELHEGDVRASPFPDRSFDAVYSPGVCEHFPEGPDAVLADAFRVLRPGGLAFVSTPFLNALRRRRWEARRAGEGDFYQYVFPAGTLTKALERVGFEGVTTHPYAVGATFAEEWPSLQRLLDRRAVGALDQVPALRRLGASAIWIARKPGGG
jgi:ubiquinone/menaquinone biosynthesis C-methylase UbiE